MNRLESCSPSQIALCNGKLLHSLSSFIAKCFILSVVLCGVIAHSSPVSATSVCDTYPEQISTAELKAMSVAIRAPLPARYVDVLSDVVVVNADDTTDPDRTLLAPESRFPLAAGPTKILVPRGFRRLNCKIIQVGSVYGTGWLEATDMNYIEIEQCISKSASERNCLENMLDRNIQRIYKTTAGSVTYDRAVRAYADQSLRFILAHEAGHIIFNRTRNADPSFARASEETAADLIASFSLLAQDETIHPAVTLFSVISVLDPYHDWKNSSHQAYICRMHSVLTIEGQIGSRIKIIQGWLNDPAKLEILHREMRPILTPPQSMGRRRTCLSDGNDLVAVATADLDRLIAGVDLAAKIASHKTLEKMDVVLAPKLVSQFVQAYRSTVISRWGLSVIVDSNGEDDGVDFENIPSLKHYSDMKNTILGIVSRIDRELDSQILPASDYARVATSTMLIKATLGSGVTSSMITNRIDAIRRYSPEAAELPFYQGIKAFKQGRCAEGTRYFQKAKEINSSIADGFGDFEFPDNPNDIDLESCQQLKKLLN